MQENGIDMENLITSSCSIHTTEFCRMTNMPSRVLCCQTQSGRTIKVAGDEFISARDAFVDELKFQMERRFPKDNTNLATSFEVLGLRTLSFLSQEVQAYGTKEMDELINFYGNDQTCTLIE